MRRIVISSLLLLFSIGTLFADNVKLVARAPSTVAVGQRFSVEYMLGNRGSDLRVNIPAELNVLMGPSESTSSNFSAINGRVTQQSSTVFTFIVKANKEGTVTIPEAQVSTKDGILKSNALTIKVVPASAAINNSNNGNGTNSAAEQVQSQAANDVNKLFVRASLSKRKVFEQEALVYTLKVYTRYTNAQISNMEAPVFSGFLSQQLDLDPNRTSTQETVNGNLYAVYTVRKDLLFPQRSGEFTIPPVKVDFVVPMLVSGGGSRSIFDGFFNTYRNVNTSVQSGATKLDVIPLPLPKPANFTGGVGQFELTSSLSSNQLKVNDPLTMKMEVKGRGNMKILETLKPQFPTDFELYDPKVTSKITNGEDGARGTVNYECLSIPRHGGTFTIPPVSFSYFDVDSKTYKTLSTPEYKVEVAKGGNDSATVTTGNMVMVPAAGVQEDVKVLGHDIRFIHTNMTKLLPQGSTFFNSLAYWLWILISLVLMLILFVVLNKQIKESQDLLKQKNKKANKMVQRRLKSAHSYMRSNNREMFYEEVLKALLNYLGDKLAIPTSELTKDNAESVLLKHQAGAEEVKSFMEIVHACELARYSPATGTDELDKTYRQAEAVIGKIDGQIKKIV